MIAARDIEAVVDQIVREFHPDKVVLFGSYAYGTPNEESDIDLMVIRRYRGNHMHAGFRIHDTLDIPFRADILVRSPAELRRRIAWGDMFLIRVMRLGITLHDSTDRRMGDQGRRRLRRRVHSAALAKAQPV